MRSTKMKTNGVYKFECKAGTYESDTLIGLLWERFRHKLWHLRKHGKWID